MLIDFLEDNIQFLDSVKDWEESIKISVQPLLDKGMIQPNYIEAIVDNVRKNGNYIIVLPEIAMPHARKEFGALQTGISFLSIKKPVYFPEETPVRLLFALSAETDDGHLELLAELAELLMDDDLVEQLKEATSKEEVLQIINGG